MHFFSRQWRRVSGPPAALRQVCVCDEKNARQDAVFLMDWKNSAVNVNADPLGLSDMVDARLSACMLNWHRTHGRDHFF